MVARQVKTVSPTRIIRPNREPNDAYPADTTAILANLQENFGASKRPLSVSFRNLVPWIKVGERATHYLHTYPAKLLPQIAHFFLAADGWLGADEIVLDPFAGAGTVPLEASLSGRTSFYADVNPLSRLITSAKVNPVDVAATEELLHTIRRRFTKIRKADIPWVVNIDLWYSKITARTLARLRRAIIESNCGAAEDFVWATFSATARKCSMADPRFAVPVRLKERSERLDAAEKPVWDTFASQFVSNLNRHKELLRLSQGIRHSHWVGTDARSLRDPFLRGSHETAMPSDSVGLILTSPPYAGAQKYIRASSLSLGWLGMTDATTLKFLENQSIGREHFGKAQLADIPHTGLEPADKLLGHIYDLNPTRAAICAHYLVEMEQAVGEMSRVLRPGGKAVVVMGDNTVCGISFPSVSFLSAFFQRKGLKLTLILVDEIRSRGLLMKRSGGAAVIQSETILVFTK